MFKNSHQVMVHSSAIDVIYIADVDISVDLKQSILIDSGASICHALIDPLAAAISR